MRAFCARCEPFWPTIALKRGRGDHPAKAGGIPDNCARGIGYTLQWMFGSEIQLCVAWVLFCYILLRVQFFVCLVTRQTAELPLDTSVSSIVCLVVGT